MNELESSKRCCTCGIVQPLTNFHNNRGTRDGRASNCKSCVSTYNKTYRAIHRDHLKEKERAWRESHAEEQRQYKREQYLADRERLLEKQRRYRKENPEKVAAEQKRQRQRPEIQDKRRIAELNRRVAKKRGPLSIVLQRNSMRLQELYESQDGIYVYCGVDLSSGYHIDHAIPLCRGGAHDWSNLVLACASCNLRKRHRTPEEFMAWKETVA